MGEPEFKVRTFLKQHKAFPDRPEFRHSEGNIATHLKSSCVGASVTLIVENGVPLLGT
jgi:thiamine phosphate synthase YjbQ (UPF0047 family)